MHQKATWAVARTHNTIDPDFGAVVTTVTEDLREGAEDRLWDVVIDDERNKLADYGIAYEALAVLVGAVLGSKAAES